jgi:extracellular elastinolytic metalloproteinase
MGRQIDLRDHSVNRVTAVRETELNSLAASVSDSLPGGHRIRIRGYDAATGNPAVVASEAAPEDRGNYVQRALEHMQRIHRALGFATTQPAEFAADPNFQTTSSGAVAVHLQQQYKGIPIFQGAETVRFAPGGAIKETVGSSVTVAHERAVEPALTVEEAVLKAAQHIAIPGADELGAKDQFGEPLEPASLDLGAFEPKIITSYPEKPDRPTVLGDELRLAWEVLSAMPDYRENYRTLVDAESGRILYCRQLVQSIAGRGNVYRVDGASPRQMTDFPRPLTDYGLPLGGALPGDFPDDWVSGEETVGNCVRAHLGEFGAPGGGSMQGDVAVFDPSDATGDEQKILNIFYYNCYMHDYFYLLSFREADGNFQRNNFGRGGLPFDRVDARAHSGAVWGTANMYTPIDGRNPIMNMGLVTSTNRHTAFDTSVVFHEFTHGVTNRLVGGPRDDRALETDQSAGMGEGWSDYIPCTINGTIVVGDWVVDDPSGIRKFPYGSNFPDNFGDLGIGRYDEVHNIGEIWCATLLEMNRNIGASLGVQLVVDALKLTPASPSFLDARDAILAALDDMRESGSLSSSGYEDARRGIWQAFARFGMGPGARSNGATLSGIVADFNTPPVVEPETPSHDVSVEATPNLAIPDANPAGVASVLKVAEPGRIARLIVSVQIEHTYIGDLRVRLTSPSGRTVVLHDRTGAGADNLVASYSSEDYPALNALVGEPAEGDWTLHVADFAGLDVGKLSRWGLEIDVETAAQSVQQEATPGIAIPDNDPAGVGSTIHIAQSGAAQDIRVSVDITHTYIGDLRVELVAPSGQRALLHSQFGGSQDNLIRTYDSSSHAALAELVGEPVLGDWEMRVADLLGMDVGKFNSWGLELNLS